MAAPSREFGPAQNAEPEALVPNKYSSVPGEFQYYLNTHPKELDHYLQLAALGAVLGSPKDSVERALKTPMTRRRALGVMAGAALAGAGLLSASHPESALADGGEPEPTPRPETRDPFVQLIDTTTLSIDPELPNETDRKTVIVGISANPFANEFAELNPDNVYDRLDRVFVELCRSIQHRRDEIRSIPDRLLSDEEFTNTPMNQRALKGEVPSQLSLEEFTQKMEDSETKEEAKKMKISLWAFDPNSDDPDKNRLMRFDPRKGMEVRILKDKPKVGFNKDGGRWVAGYTHEIIDEKLHIGIYRQDFKPTAGGGNPDNGIYTPSYNVDISYSNLLRLVIEDLILYGGNKQMHDGIVVKYLAKQNELPSASLFPEVAELSLGALRNYDAFGGYAAYDSAPVLHIQSPSVDPANRYRQ